MSKGMAWVLVVLALLVGAYAGYAYEKAKFVKLMDAQRMDMQNKIDSAKGSQKTTTIETPVIRFATNDKSVTYATGRAGKALYTYDKDTNGKSSCTGDCEQKWPAYLTGNDLPSPLPEHIGTVQRDDGSRQFTWDSKPLYYYSADKVKEDTSGDGVGGVWHLAK